MNETLLQKAYDELLTEQLYDSAWHGKSHILRTMKLGALVAENENLSDYDTMLLLKCCSYHDVGRKDDTYDEKHGERSAERIACEPIVGQLDFLKEGDLSLMQAVIAAHSRPDRDMGSVPAAYGIEASDRYFKLASCLKEADNLDRVRLGDFDGKHLRFKRSIPLIETAQRIYGESLKNVLFFGDSNTWGYEPGTGERYPYGERWTTITSKALGIDYRCIVSGMNGRTTVFDDPWKDCRNGKTALDIELQSHKPLDLIVIMLGTNDLKFGPASVSARGMETLVSMAMNANSRFATSSPVFPKGAKVLIISPILVGSKDENNPENDLMPNGHEESKKFAKLLAGVAENYGCYFLDAAQYAKPSDIDCQHMTREGHAALAAAVTRKIREIFSLTENR